MIKKTYIIVTLIIIAIILISTVIKDTYSKYISTGEIDINGYAGAWTIEVNGQNITNNEGTSQTFTIQSLNYSSSQYVKPGKIAPGTYGDFSIAFKTQENAVAYRFDITLDLTNIETTERIQLSSVKKYVNNVEEQNGIIRTGENTYTGIVLLENITNDDEIVVKCEVEWPNDTTGENDIKDSQLGTNSVATYVNIPVTVNVTQYSGETITQYTEV